MVTSTDPIQDPNSKLAPNASSLSSPMLKVLIQFPEEKEGHPIQPLELSLSPEITLADLRNICMEFTVHDNLTAFSLVIHHKEYPDYTVLASILDEHAEKEGLHVVVRKNEYTHRDARFHVHRLRLLLQLSSTEDWDLPIYAGSSVLPSLQQHEGQLAVEKDTENKNEEEHAFIHYHLGNQASIDALFPKTFEQDQVVCLKKLVLSSWHPPTRQHTLQGPFSLVFSLVS